MISHFVVCTHSPYILPLYSERLVCIPFHNFHPLSAWVTDLEMVCVLFLLFFLWGLNEASQVITAASSHMFFTPYLSLLPFPTLISCTLATLISSSFSGQFFVLLLYKHCLMAYVVHLCTLEVRSEVALCFSRL